MLEYKEYNESGVLVWMGEIKKIEIHYLDPIMRGKIVASEVLDRVITITNILTKYISIKEYNNKNNLVNEEIIPWSAIMYVRIEYGEENESTQYFRKSE